MSEIILTEAILESLRTKSGGYNRKTLVYLGVGWPPYKKWKKKLVGQLINANMLSLAWGESKSDISDVVLYGRKSDKRSTINYPSFDSKFEIQSFIYHSLKNDFDIRGQVYSDMKNFDLVLFKNKKASMIINILCEGELFDANYPENLPPAQIIRTMVEAKGLVDELTKKKLGLN